ncbi:hypothetical protein [Neisseria animalis]|uniref:Uncharacterized protein n=1 Tax=Neisseria animalis TaxID=492 RepID=A0A5P3MR77_NEIAN|nr:hypothetical protein [Neisseria animalis]QEY24106.1 hypothetical protein D0T90_06050 [Neisseria animalis]ROW32674.1 hypothetical protein CGZ60_04390 [Neisseria animalis]VEE06298.1 cofactor-independent phosphoglycerate mutase [Neisseria animalis]
MKLTLVIPSLHRLPDETPPLLKLPAFNRMLRYGRLQKATLRPSECYARYLWQGSLLERAKACLNLPDEIHTAFASPLWQQMGLHHVSIVGGAYAGITSEEAEHLCSGLNEFYRQDGWRFYPVSPDLWLLAKPFASEWNVAPVWDICGQIGSTDQADGQDALEWLGKQTEIQMWLHDHPVNRARAAQNLPPLNGLWLWQDIQGSGAAELTAADGVWAKLGGGTVIDVPYDFPAYRRAAQECGRENADGLICLEDLVVTAQTGDVWAYQEILESWEARWFEPLWQELRTGRLQKLTIATDGENGGELTLTPRSHRAFWKRPKTFRGMGWE